jgi:6-pyruvoyl-tetrahydropterin synthase
LKRTILFWVNAIIYHGHNYDLIVNVTGDIDPETGFVMDVKGKLI